MYVCVERGGAVAIVGETSLLAPYGWPGRPGIISVHDGAMPIADPGSVWEYQVKDVTLPGGRGRVIMLRAGDDPTNLPDWHPYPRRPGVYVRDRERFIDYVLEQVSEEEFRRAVERDISRYGPYLTPIPGSLRGRPQIWALFGQTVEVWQEPTDEYEVIDLSRRERTYHFGDLGRPGEVAEILPRDYSTLPNMRDFLPTPFATFQGVPFYADERIPPSIGIQGLHADYVIQDDPVLRQTTAEFITRQQEEVLRDMGGGALAGLRVPQGTVTAANMQAIEEHAVRIGYNIARERMEDNLYRQMFGPRIAPVPAAARARARGLLKSLITPAQWAEFDAHGHVFERIGDVKFTLRPGMRIEARKRLLGRSVREFWCVSPSMAHDWIPPEDQLIGQLLHLRADPDRVRNTANIFNTQGYV